MITQGGGAGPGARSLILSTPSPVPIARITLKESIQPAIFYGNVPQFIEAQSLVFYYFLYFSFFFLFFFSLTTICIYDNNYYNYF